jgi:trehalose-6-phosphate synthase
MPVATVEMEQLVAANVQLINTFREDMQVLCRQDVSMRSVKKVILSRFEELLDKVCINIYMNADYCWDA